MSTNSRTQAAKKQSTVTVEPHCVGRVIGPEGRIVKRIARDAGAGCRIQFQGNGQFLVEAWTNAAITLAKRWVIEAAGRDTTPAPKATRKVTTAKPPQKPPQKPTRGTFAALASDSEEEEDETKTTETTTKATTEKKTTKIDPTQLGFVDEGAGRFRRHQDWVNRQKWFGHEVEEGTEVHPSLAQHLQRLEGQNHRLAPQPKAADFTSRSDFPSLGGGAVAGVRQSNQWGTDEGLARAMSELAHVEKPVVETSSMQDLSAKQTEVLSLPTAPDLLKPGLLRHLSCGTAAKQLPPINNGLTGETDGWGSDDDWGHEGGWDTSPGDAYDQVEWA